MKKIAILKSGGDSPGMNAAVRASARAASYFGYAVEGVMFGYRGLIKGEFIELDKNSVSGIMQRGGTILKTARSEEFMKPEGRAKAAGNLKKIGADALVAIGGDGTFRGATILAEEHNLDLLDMAKILR